MGYLWLRQQYVMECSLIYLRFPHHEPLIVMAIVYRHTRLVRYLDTARSMAGYFLNNIPADGIIPCVTATKCAVTSRLVT